MEDYEENKWAPISSPNDIRTDVWRNAEKPTELDCKALCVVASDAYSSDSNSNNNSINNSISSSSSSSGYEEEEDQNIFTEKFLRRREELAQRDIVREVRSLMRDFCLPPVDVEVIEKYIILAVERREEVRKRQSRTNKPFLMKSEKFVRTDNNIITNITTTTTTTTNNNNNNNKVVEDSSVDAFHEFSPGNTNTLPSAAAAVPRSREGDSGAVYISVRPTMTPVDPHTTASMYPHSRHAAWYTSAYEELRGWENEKHYHVVYNSETEEKENIHHGGNGYIHEKHAARHLLRKEHLPPMKHDNDNSHSHSGNMMPSFSFFSQERSIVDIMQLRWLLLRHKEQTLHVLDCIDQREEIMSKLRAFLLITSKDLFSTKTNSPPVRIHNETPHRSQSRSTSKLRPWSSKGKSHGEVLSSSLSSSSLLLLSRGLEAHVPAGRSIHSHRVHVEETPLRSGAPVTQRRYYRRGVLYLLRQLQCISVVLLQAVGRWRKALSGNYPFVVKGCNYVLHMALEMANLSKEPVLQMLFQSSEKRPPQPQPSETTKKKNQRKNISEKKRRGKVNYIIDDPPDVVSFPESLQYYPLLSNMPELVDYCRPPQPLRTEKGTMHFDFGDTVNFPHAVIQNDNNTTTAARRRLHKLSSLSCAERKGGVPAEVVYLRCVYAAEESLQREVSLQIHFLRRNFAACAEKRYPLLLRGVGELCGSRDKMVGLESRQRQREWYWYLRDMLTCLEEGSPLLSGY